MLPDFATAINNIISPPKQLNMHLILQLTPPEQNLVIPLPPPSLLHGNFVEIRENIFGCTRESNQTFRGESSTSQSPCYQLLLHSKFYSLFNLTTTVQDTTVQIFSIPVPTQDIFLCSTTPHIYPNLSTRWTGQKRLTNSQAATHENWLMRCYPRARELCREQSTYLFHLISVSQPLGRHTICSLLDLPQNIDEFCFTCQRQLHSHWSVSQ